MEIEIKVHGAENVARALTKVWEESQHNLAAAMRDVLHVVYQDAYRDCPVITGALQRSILIGMKRKRVWITGTISATGGAKGKTYAAYVELGAQGRSAKPFLVPALRKNEKYIIEKLGKAVEKAIFTVHLKSGMQTSKL